MFRFACPYCDASIRANESQCGSITRCPKCREPWRVPTEPGGEVDTNPLAGVEEEPVEPAAEYETTPPEPPPIRQPADWPKRPVYSPTYGYPPQRSQFNSVIGWAVVAAVPMAAFGVVVSQYFPVFGGLFMLGKPWSPARQSLISGHVLMFGLIGLILGGLLGFVRSR